MTEKFLVALLGLGEVLRNESLTSEDDIVKRCNDVFRQSLEPAGLRVVVSACLREDGAIESKFVTPVGDRWMLTVQGHAPFEARDAESVDLEKFFHEVAYRIHAAFEVRETQRRLSVLSAEKARLEKIAQLGSWAWDSTRDQVDWSDSLFELFERDKDAGAPPFAEQHLLYEPDDFKYLQELVREALKEGDSFEATLRTRTPSGAGRIVLTKGWPRVDEKGNRIGLEGTIRDVTDLFRTRRELNLKSMALESMAHGFDIVSADGKLLYVNQAYLDMWGFDSIDEVLDTSPQSHCVDPSVPGRIIAELKERDIAELQFKARRKDGSEFDVEMYCRRFQDWRGRDLYTGVSVDVTERNELRRKYHQAQKMEAVGRLTGGVAHDFNNLLHVVLGSLELGLLEVEPDSEIGGDLKNAKTAAEKASSLVKQLLVFSRHQAHNPEWLNLGETVPQTIAMLHRLVGDHIQVRFEPAPELKLVMIDKGMLDQVLVNLIINSRDALGSVGGSITVRVDVLSLADEGLLNCHEVTAGEFCRIQVSDDGCGMSRDCVERAFEPFYSTKVEGKGSGLGLSTVYGIAKRHRGFVTLDSKPGYGTTVSVFFPLSVESPEVDSISADSTPRPLPKGKEELILVVEDNELVRSLMTRELTRAGYRVMTAEDGLEALSLYNHASEAIDLILTDLSMPRMGGAELIRTLRKKDPATKALIVTGYNDGSSIGGGELLEGGPVLQKPYLREELLLLVSDLLRHSS